jgi:hypothetical protein
MGSLLARALRLIRRQTPKHGKRGALKKVIRDARRS